MLDSLDRWRAGPFRAFRLQRRRSSAAGTHRSPRRRVFQSEELRASEQILRETLRREGLGALLRFLNARTRHRFTAVYRFEPPWLRNVCTVDRENPELTLTADCRIRESYCGFVFEQAERFTVADAAADPRVADHPKRDVLLAYCGVPVFDEAGACIGTVCHFDPRPRLTPPSELPLLECAASLVAPWVARAGKTGRPAAEAPAAKSARPRAAGFAPPPSAPDPRAISP